MVSIYSLRPVCTFLYTIINGNAIASFVQKNKNFEILRSKKIFFLRTYATLKPPSPIARNCTHLAWPSPPPLCIRTMWMTPYEHIRYFLIHNVYFVIVLKGAVLWIEGMSMWLVLYRERFWFFPNTNSYFRSFWELSITSQLPWIHD